MMQRRSLALLPGMLLLAHCSPPPPPPPSKLILTIKAGAAQNPDPAGQPRAVAVRLYMLNATGKFDGADVFALTERERATLAEDSAGSEDILVAPGETKTIERDPAKNVRALGVAVLFRDIDRATWRVTAPIAASGPTKLVLTIDGLKATLATQ